MSNTSIGYAIDEASIITVRAAIRIAEACRDKEEIIRQLAQWSAELQILKNEKYDREFREIENAEAN